jgi:hypothetical protein
MIAGVYPMIHDETCRFLAIDFDGEGWKDDIKIINQVCEKIDILPSIERSRSGNGAHVWFFFEEKVPAILARKFGSAILTFAMNMRHEIKFRNFSFLSG